MLKFDQPFRDQEIFYNLTFFSTEKKTQRADHIVELTGLILYRFIHHI